MFYCIRCEPKEMNLLGTLCTIEARAQRILEPGRVRSEACEALHEFILEFLSFSCHVSHICRTLNVEHSAADPSWRCSGRLPQLNVRPRGCVSRVESISACEASAIQSACIVAVGRRRGNCLVRFGQ